MTRIWIKQKSPQCPLWLKGSCMLHKLPFDIAYLAKPPHVPLRVRKFRGQKCADEFFRQFNSDHPRPKTEDFHIVIFNSLPRGKGIMTDGRTDAGKFVCRDACTDAAA